MFKQPVKLLASLNNVPVLFRHSARSESAKIEKNHKWDLISAVCVERHPVITKPMTEIETNFKKLLMQIEFENSMKCDHELQLLKEQKQLDMHKKGLLELDMDSTVQQEAQDLEDAGEAELEAFKLGSRVTVADEKNITNSLDRKLDKSLVLLVEQKLGKDSFWLPPQSTRATGETMRQAADRAMKEICGNDLNLRIYGNAPIGFYKYTYPKAIRENGIYGAKVFYYLARYLNGSIPETVKHQWLDREELEKTMPRPIHKSVSMFLVTD